MGREPKDIADFYERLGVSRNATGEEIRKAWAHLASKYHPDGKEIDDDNMKAVNEAYTMLGTKKKRAIYDRLGEVHFRTGSKTSSGSGFEFTAGRTSIQMNGLESILTLAGFAYPFYEGFTRTVGGVYGTIHDNFNILYFDSLAWIPSTAGAATAGAVGGLVIGGIFGFVGAKVGYSIGNKLSR